MSETTPSMSKHGLILYKARIDQIEFLKKQQWTVTNYLAIIYGAIVWIGYNTPKSPVLVCTLSATAIIAAVVGITLLVWFQIDTAHCCFKSKYIRICRQRA